LLKLLEQQRNLGCVDAEYGYAWYAGI